MNKVYRLIWSEIVSAWVVVAEHVKARGKRASSKMGHVHGGGAMAVFALAGGIALSVNLAYAAPPAANQLPTGGQIVGGAAAGNIAASGNTMTVTQNNQRMIANWQSFSVGKDATVQFNQPSASSIALNRVVGQDPSQIMGRLNANGQVMLINPSGIVFGHGSQVNVGGLVASTLAISDANFNAGKYSLAQGATPAGSISNAGTITVPAGGVVALVAPSVENTGAIYTPQGSTALAAGTSVDLDFGGDGLITVRVNQSTLDALAKNGGLIQADDGYVILTAGSAKQILAGAVNNSGIIRAQGITRQGGRIVLDGGTVTNTGTLDVSSQHHAGGQIQVSGNTVNLGGTLKASGTTGGSVQVESLDQQIVTAQILAQGNSGAGGSINLASMSKIIIDFPAGEAKGRLDASGATDGGSIHLSGLSLQFTNALLSVAGEAGAGGDIALDATGGINVADSTLDASGETKGGNIQLAAGATPNPNTPAPFPTDIPTNIALTGYTMLRVNSRRGQGGNLDLEAIGGNLNLEADTDLEANGETGGSLTLTGYVVGTGGTLQANGATNGMGGMGGTIQVNASQALIDTGNMQATGDTGGHIQLNVHNLIEAGQLDASGMTQGGSIVINASGSVEQMYAASLKADGGVNGGSIRITAAGKAYLSGSESANGAAGLGGSIALTAPDLSLVGARVHADGALGGGLIRVGGGWQGGDADLTNALTTDVNTSSLLTANATQQGHGGTVVLWSENHTTFAGDIEAKGGAAGGNGGQVEISSHDTLGFAGKVTTAAPNGANGSLLLDPRNLNIETTVTAAITKLELTYANPKSNDYFGNQVKVLANGNIVVANYLDDSVAPDSGAVRLYKQDGTLLSTLTGSATNDYVGMSGIIALTNGNFVVGSYIWGGNKGASTWVNGTTGLTGMVSAANSLVGSTANDRVGLSGIALANGNYVLNTQAWASYRGAVTWGSGTVGVKGTIDSTNSLVGSSTYDSIGNYGVVALSNGNYVVKSTAWGASSNDTNTGKGAVTWGNGASGVKGYVSSTNSVVGSVNGDLVGDGVFNELSNGNYVFSSFRWNSRRGAVTWGSGTSGAVGEVGASNSLVGVNVNDYVGQRVTSLSNGNYVVTSIMVNYLGASTWANGATGITGSVTSTNSLMGTSTSDYVGSTVTALSNGNYVIGSSSWSGYKGAATWVNGTVGITGAISSANSLIGSAASDYVGYNVIALTNGHYVTSSQYWSGNKGAVTWGNGTSGVTGVVSSSNSLVGDVTNANAGLYLKALTNGNYVAATLGYGTGTTMQYGKGAVTWGNGATGITGTVSSANSLVGASAGDRIGGMEDSNGLVALTNGNYVVVSTRYGSNGNATGPGAVTWGNGATGTTGIVSSTNSLVGSGSNDRVGYMGITALTNGNYVVVSPFWGSSQGAVTWGSGTSGVTGIVSASNSLVGSANEMLTWTETGAVPVYALANGNYVVVSPKWGGNGTIRQTKGAVTWGDGAIGVKGTIDATNSLVGSAYGDRLGDREGSQNEPIVALANSDFFVKSGNYNVNQGAITWMSGVAATVGTVNTTNSLVGSASDRMGDQWSDKVFAIGNSLLVANDVADNVQYNSGRVVILSGPSSFTNPMTYGTNSGADNTITASGIVSLLNAGTNVTLQASNDLTLNSAISANNTSGNGGALNLAAGRSVLLNANIVTDNGDLNIIANDTAAHGVVNADRQAGSAVVTMGAGTSINAGTGAVNIQLLNGAGNTNNTSGEITLRDITAGNISVVNSGGTGGVTLAAGALTASGTGNALVLSGKTFTNSSSSAAAALAAANGRWLVYTDGPGSVTKNGLTSAFRHYSASYGTYAPASVTETGKGFIYASAAGALSVATTLASGTASSSYGDTPTASYGYTLTGFADSEDSASNIGISGTATYNGPTATSAAGSYTVSYQNGLSNTAGYTFSSGTGLAYTVNKRVVTLTGSRAYDGAATAAGSILSASNIVGSDALSFSGSATLASKNAGSQNITSISGLTLGGTSSGNYTLTGATGSVTVSKKAVTLTGTGIDRTYNGGLTYTTTAGDLTTLSEQLGVSGDTVTAATQAYTDKNAGGSKTVTIGSATISDGNSGNNYTITYANGNTGIIRKKAVTLTGAAATKTYDGLTSYTTTASDLTALSGQLGVSGDTVTAATQAYTNKNAGTGKAVSVSGATINDGNSGNNYTITYANGNSGVINKKAVTLTAQAATKTYDGALTYTTTAGDLTALSSQLGVSGDTVTAATQAYADKNAGTGKTVTVSAATVNDGNSGNNYTITYANATSGVINKKAVTLTALATTKTYDGGLTYTNTAGDLTSLSGQLGVSGDTVTAATQAYSDKNAGTGKTVTLSAATVSDGNSGNNYTITYANGASGTISKKAVTLTGVAATKTYDGDLTYTTTAGDLTTLSGQLGVSGDTVTAVTQAYTNKNAGTGKAVSVSSATINDGNSGNNYTITYANGASGVINKKAVTLTAQAATKTYDGGLTYTTTAGDLTALSGQLGVSGDTVTAATQAYTDKNAGTGKTVTVSGATISDGNSGNNYTVTYANGASGVINQLAVTLTGSRDYDGTATAAGGIISAANKVSGDTLSFTGNATLASKNAGVQNITDTSVLTLSGTDAGNYTLTGASGNVTVNKKAVTLTGVAATKTYDGDLTYTTTAGDLTTLSGQLGVSGDTVTAATQAYTNKNAGTGKAVSVSGATISDGNGGNNYTITYANGSGGEISKKAVTLTALAASKTYDGLTSYTNTASDLTALSGQLGVSGDTVTAATQAYSDKNASTGKTVTLSGATISDGNSGNNYTVTYATNNSGEISKKALSVSGITASNKEYDGTTAATLSVGSAVFGGKVTGDDLSIDTGVLSGSFADANAGTSKAVNLTGATLSGTDAGNYTLSGVGGVTADITKKALTVTATDAARTYDGTNWTGGNGVSYSGFIAGEDDTALGGTLAYGGTAQSSRNAGTYTLSASGLTSGNYNISYVGGNLVTSKKAVTLTALAASKTYDGLTSYTNTASDLTALSGQLGVSGDTITAATQAYSDKNAGTGKTVTLSGATISDGNSGNNYTITYANGSSGEISKKALTVSGITASNKEYDGTTTASLSVGSAVFGGKVTGDDLSIDTGVLSGSFADANAGTSKAVNLTGATLSGTDAGNYTLSGVGGVTADITQKALIVTATDAARTYDGTNWTGGNGVSYSGFITGEDATALGGTLAYGGTAQSSRNAGTYTLSASGLTSGNYNISYVDGSLVTSKKAVTLTALAASKTYDGLTSYTNTASDLTALSGQLGVSGDTITAATQAYADKNASTGKTVTLSGATVSDGNSGNNYTITYATNNSGEISKKALTVSGITAANKEYDGTTAAVLSLGSVDFSGKVTGDDLSIDTGVLSGSFADANAGTSKAVNLTGATLSGTDAGNYTLSGVGGVTADITQKALIVTATDAARTYDGTNWTGGNGVSYSGFITGEDATALGGTLTYGGTAQDSRNAGTYTLSASGLTATNYAITYAAGSLVTSKKAVTLTGLATSKVYDGGLTYTTTADDLTSLSSQLGVSGDTITAATQAYTDRNVGTGKTVTLSSATISDGNSGNNYTITYANGSSGAITKLNVTVADITAANKTYSGTTAATLSAGSASITGKVSGDALNVDATGLSGSFDTKSVGTGKTVNYTGIALSGADVGNYNLTSSTGTTTADISKLDVTVADITALNKTYDRTTDATMSTSSASITGKVAGDALNVDATGLSGTFDTWNAGNGKTVSYTGVALSGADAGNYNLTSSTGTTTANITPRSLTVSGITAANKDYDGTTSVALSVGTAAFSGVLGADVVTITPDVIGGSFADKNAGTSKAINLTGVTLSGTEASNYTLDSVVGVTADIAPVALQIAANDMTYAYNGTNFSNGNGVTYTGFVNGETSGVLDGTLAYDGTSQGAKNAGSYTLSASGLTASNYTIEYVDGALIITPKALMMTGVTATDKIYDGNTSATVSGGTLNGLVGTETLNVTKTGMFDTPDAGTGKTVRVMFAMADGINGGLASNYTLDDTTTTASITSEVTLPTNPTPPPTNPPPPPAPPPPGPTPPSDPIDTGTGTSPGTPSGNDTNTDTTPDGNDPNTGLIPGGDDTNTGTTPDSNNPDSNNPDPDTSTRNNPDGSTTTTTTAPDGTDTETTTAPDGKTTTTATSSEGGKTTVTTNPDGSTTATGTEPDGTTITSTVYPDGTTSVSTTNPDGSTTTQVTAPDGRSETTTTNTDGSLKITSVAPDGTLSTSVTYPDGSTTTTTILPDNTVNTNTVNKDGSSEKVTVGTDGGMTKSIMNVGGAVEMTTTNADGSTVKVTISSDGTMVKTTTGTDGTVTRRSEKVNVSGMPVETIGLQLPVAQLTKGFILLEAIWQQQHSEMAVVLSVTGAGGKSLPTTVHYDQATGRLSVNGTSAEVEVLMLDKAGNLRRLKLTVKEGVVNLKEK